MRQVTIRLPDSLHQQLKDLAQQECVSLNQYIVRALGKQTVPDEAIREQRTTYNALLQGLGQTSFEEIEAAMAERETADPEAGLTQEVVERLRQKMNERRP